MRWSGATGAIARCKRVSTGCGRKRRSVPAWPWICGGKPKPKVVNKPSPHSIVHGLDKPGVFTTVSVFFFCHMLPDHAHEFVKFHLKRCFVTINALQLAHEFSDVLMGEAAVSHELRPMLAGHGFIRRIEDALFQLRVQIKLGKDLLSNQILGTKIPGALIS